MKTRAKRNISTGEERVRNVYMTTLPVTCFIKFRFFIAWLRCLSQDRIRQIFLKDVFLVKKL